jgi:hypothetical protein
MEPCTQQDRLAEMHKDIKEIKDIIVTHKILAAKVDTKVTFYTPVIAVLFSIIGYLLRKIGWV